MKFFKSIFILTIAFSFIKCGSTKLEKNPPFEIAKATYTNWVGGQPGVSGTNLAISFAKYTEVSFDSIFYQGKKTKAEIKTKENSVYIMGYFNTSNRKENNMVLDIDSKKEVNNKPPKKEDFPFKLEANEAVISYMQDGEIKYFKVSGLKNKKAEVYQ